MKQLDEYKTFNDLGKNGIPRSEYNQIEVHLIYDIKHDTRQEARGVADGHLAEVPLDSVYYGVVLLRGLHMMVFVAEINQLDIWVTDIGNAYLEAKISDKFYITAGQGFGEKRGNTLIIYKSLYGLCSSGAI